MKLLTYLSIGLISFTGGQLIAHEETANMKGSAVVTTEVVTGNGMHRYVTIPGWGQMPSGEPLGPTHGGVCVDKNGNVYTSTEATHGVVVFDSDGNFLRTFEPSHLHNLALVEEDGEEFILAANNDKGEVLKLSLSGEVVFRITDETHPEIPDGLTGVTAIAGGGDGSLYVVTGYGSHRLHKFDGEGKYLASVGGKGLGAEQFETCHGVSLDTRFESPRLLVSDREKGRLVHFDLEMNYLSTYADKLRRPCAVAFHGDLCAVAELAGRVTILDLEGTPVAFLGDQPDLKLRAIKEVPAQKLQDGVFTAPHGLAFDKKGNLYVQDWNVIGRLTALRKLP